MSALAALSCFGLPLLCGAAFLRLVGLRWRDDRLAWLGWAWSAGGFWTGAVVLGWAWGEPDTASAVRPAAVLAALALAFGLGARFLRGGEAPDAAVPSAPRAGTLERASFACVTALVVASAAGRVVLGTLRPVVEDDEANFWALKAQMLFAHGGFGEAFGALAQEPRLYNADYPLLNPCLQLWTFAHAGELTHVVNRLPIQLFGVALLLVLAGALRRVARPALAALLLACVASLFELSSQLARGHGDLMAGLGALVACDAWLRWERAREPRWARLLAFGLAFALFSKNEGQLVAACVAGAALVTALVRRRRAAGGAATAPEHVGGSGERGSPRAAWAWLALPLAVLLAGALINRHFGWRSGFLAGAERDATIVGLLRQQLGERALPVLAFYRDRLLLDPQGSRGLLVAFLGLLAAAPRRSLAGPLLAPALAIGAFYLGTMLVFVGAPHDLQWHLTTAAQRVGFQPLASVALWVAAAAGRAWPGLAPRA